MNGSAVSICEEFLPALDSSQNINEEEVRNVRVIDTAVLLKDLSALGMRMYELGWILTKIDGFVSKVDSESGIASTPLVVITFCKPKRAYNRDEIPFDFS